MANTEKIILEVEFDSAQADKNVDELTKSIISLEQANKNLRNDAKKSDEQLKKEGKSRVDLAKQIEFNKQKLSEEKKERTASLKIIKSENNSRNQLKATVTKLKQARDKLDTTNKKEAKQIRKLNKEIDKQNNKLNKSKSSTEGLSGAISSAIPGLGGLGSAIQKVGAIIKIALGPFGLILAALGALIAFFKGSEEGQDRLNKIMTVGRTIIGNIADSFRDFGRVVLDSILVLGARFTKFFAKIGLGWQKLKGIFKDNTEAIDEQRQKIEEAEKVIIERQNQRRKSTEELTKGIKNLISETQREIKIAQDLADRQNKLNKDTRANLVREAELRRDIANIRAQAADRENMDAETRLSLLDKAIEKENEILDNSQRLAQERLKLKQIENSLADSTREDLEEEAQLRAALIQLETTNADKRRRLLSERLIAEREIKAAEREAELEFEREFNSDLVELAQETADQEKAILEELEQAERDSINKRLELRRQLSVSAVQGAQLVANTLFSIQKNNLQRETQARLAQEGLTEKEALKIQREAAKERKKIAITEVIVNGALAIAKTFATLGWPAGIVGAAFTAANTLAQLAVINSQQFAKGGEIKFGSGGSIQSGVFSGPSHSAGGIGLTTDSGHRVEVEGNEGMYIVNKKDNPAAIAMLSAINSMHGKAFSTPVSFAQDGGEISANARLEQNRQIQEAISKIVVVTKVTDINNVQADRATTVNNAIVNA
jgi:hypothetical protein